MWQEFGLSSGVSPCLATHQVLVFSPSSSGVRNPPAMQETQETQVRFLGREDPLEEEMAPPLQYSCLENPMDSPWGYKRVRYNLATKQQPPQVQQFID